jgi:hypothetical protein
MTVGEVANIYASAELNILPEFPRLFRWTPERKSAFVESILIGIPIPPAFVFEKEDGTWELIEFMGVLKDPDTGDYRRSKLPFNHGLGRASAPRLPARAITLTGSGPNRKPEVVTLSRSTAVFPVYLRLRLEAGRCPR